ncbi:hypothetical protein PIB30_103641, partial [Stylosanthes scabra]|nr:hypothetical protein [Stylosanthes scabra]
KIEENKENKKRGRRKQKTEEEERKKQRKKKKNRETEKLGSKFAEDHPGEEPKSRLGQVSNLAQT